MKIVSPYRPFAAESLSHQRIGPFDWIGALRMLAVSAHRSCHCETFAITDVDSDLGVPVYQFVTAHRRLMPWILEVSLRYLESDAFDQDTVMVSPDILVFGDLRRYFMADLGLVVRLGEKYTKRPLLNSIQWWAHAAKPRLVTLYREALRIAETLPDSLLTWGGDTVPLVMLLEPFKLGRFLRGDLSVWGSEHTTVTGAVTIADIARMDRGLPPIWPTMPAMDFKYRRKLYMRQYFDATLGAKVSA